MLLHWLTVYKEQLIVQYLQLTEGKLPLYDVYPKSNEHPISVLHQVKYMAINKGK